MRSSGLLILFELIVSSWWLKALIFSSCSYICIELFQCCWDGSTYFRAITIGKWSVKSDFKMAVLKSQVNTWSIMIWSMTIAGRFPTLVDLLIIGKQSASVHDLKYPSQKSPANIIGFIFLFFFFFLKIHISLENCWKFYFSNKRLVDYIKCQILRLFKKTLYGKWLNSFWVNTQILPYFITEWLMKKYI